MKRIVLGLAVTLAMGSAIAQAPKPHALVRADAGTVQVQGSGALALNESTGAQAGDIVSVTDGKATVTYADGCIVEVVSSHQIAAVTQCKAGLLPGSASVGGSDRLLVGAGIGALVVLGVALGSGGSDSASSP